MKKILLAFWMVVVTFAVNAQTTSKDQTATRPAPGHTGIINSDRAEPFWEEDFGSGFPSDWAIIDSSGICPWTYTFDGTWGYWNGDDGMSANDPMNSTTADNGYLICDNDSANHYTYGQPSGTTYEYLSSYFGTSAIDCSGETSVILRFEQTFRYNNGVAMIVQVSNDSSSWTSYDVSGGTPDNTFSDDPDIVVLNISPIAAGESTVYLRFGWSARVYFWSIDDISLSPAEPNDIIMQNGFWQDGGVNEYQHYKIPLSQPSPITFRGGISNNTGEVLDDISVSFDLNDGTGSVFSGTSSTGDLNSTELDTFDVTTTWTPDAVGDYTATYTAVIDGVTDGDLTNNEFTDQFQITSSIYGLDNLTDGLTGSSGGISNWSGNGGFTFGIGNVHEIFVDDEVECVEIGISNLATNEGQVVYGVVYVWNGSEWEWRGQTEDYNVTAADVGQVVSLIMDDPAYVAAGELMLVCAGHYGGTDTEFAQAQAVPDQMVYGYDGDGTFFWLASPRAIVCRANFSCGLGTDELENTVSFDCYPNPFDSQLNVAFELSQPTTVSLQLMDINGRIVWTQGAEEMASGKNEATINTADLAPGVYTIEVQMGDQKNYQKVILER